MRRYGSRRKRSDDREVISPGRMLETPALSPSDCFETESPNESARSSPATPKATSSSEGIILRAASDSKKRHNSLISSTESPEDVPRKVLRYSSSARSASPQDEGNEESTSEEEDVEIFKARKPSSSTVASRMAPRPALSSSSGKPAWVAHLRQMIAQMAAGKQTVSDVAKSAETGRHCYGATESTQTTSRTNSDEQEKADVDLVALQGRWHDLDEMDNSDEVDASSVSNLQTITILRSAGEHRQFLDEFEYLTFALHANCKPKVWTNICVDLAIQVSSPLGSDAFFTNLRMANLTGRLIPLLFKPRRANVTTWFADWCIAFIISKMLEFACLPDEIAACDFAVVLMTTLLSSEYGKSVPRTSGVIVELLKQAGTLFGCRQEVSMHPHIVVLYAFKQLVIQAKSRSSFGRSLEVYSEVIDLPLCKFLQAHTAKLERDSTNIFVLAAIEGCCTVMMQLDSVRSIPTGQSLEGCTFTSLMTSMQAQPGHWQAGALDCLCSALRLLLSLFHQENTDFSHNFASNSESITGLTGVYVRACNSAIKLDQTADADASDVARLYDISALSLGLLTVLLEREAEQATKTLVTESDLVLSLAQLWVGFSERKHDQHSRIWTGCLTVTLALLIVKTAGNDARRTIVGRLLEAAKMTKPTEVRALILESLHAFAEDTSGTMEGMRTFQQTLLQDLSTTIRRLPF